MLKYRWAAWLAAVLLFMISPVLAEQGEKPFTEVTGSVMTGEASLLETPTPDPAAETTPAPEGEETMDLPAGLELSPLTENVMLLQATGSGSITVKQDMVYTSGTNRLYSGKIQFALLKDGQYVTQGGNSAVPWVLTMWIQWDGLQPKQVTFDNLPDGNYEVVQVHGDVNNDTISRNYVGMLMDDPSVQLASIHVTENSNGTNNNNVHITGGSSASLTFQNTYQSVTDTVSFEARKVWMDRQLRVISPPEDAAVAFTLFKEVNGVTTSTERIIVLDGVADNDGELNPWQAVFTDLPRTENGQTIKYKVKETSGWPDYYACKNKGMNLMRDEYLELSGGTIYNRQLLATIQIQKHFDIQPNKYSAEDWAEMLAKKQLTFELTNETTHETWYFTLDDSFKQNGQLFFYNVENMQAGHYVLREYRYKGLITDRKWDRGITVFERDVDPTDNMDNPLVEMEVQNWYVAGQDEPEGAYIKALKVWDDLDDFDGIRPDSIQVTLKAEVNGAAYELTGVNNSITLSAENDWNTGNAWANLPLTDAQGRKINYSVVEIHVPEGYTSTTTVSDNGTDKSYTFTNTHRPTGSGSIVLQKVVDAPAEAEAPASYAFLITNADGLYMTEAGEATAVKTAITIDLAGQAAAQKTIQLPVGRYTIVEVREGIELSGYALTVTGEGSFDVRVNQNEPVVVTNRYVERIDPPDEKHLHLMVEKKWLDENGRESIPDNASATFVLHQQRAMKESSEPTEASITVVTVDGQTLAACNPGDTLVISFSGPPNSGDNIMVQNGSNSWDFSYDYRFTDDSGQGSIEKKVEQGYSGASLIVKTQGGTLSIASVTRKSAAEVTYSDYADTSYTQTITLPTAKGSWLYVFQNLVQEDEDGNRYRYYITEDACSPAAISTAFKDSLGADATHAISTDGQTVEVSNTWHNEGEPDPDPVEIPIAGRKELVNKELTEAEFTFLLYEATAAGEKNGDSVQATTHDADGAFRFTVEIDAAMYNARKNDAGEAHFYYVMAEEIPEDAVNNIKNNVQYDTTEYLVEIVVHQVEDELVADPLIVTRLEKPTIPQLVTANRQ